MTFLQELENVSKDIEAVQGEALDIDMLEPLIDLGYLRFEQCQEQNAEQNTFLKQAISQFRTDYEALRLLSKRFTFETFDKEYYHYYDSHLNEVERTTLQKLVSLEGDFSIHTLPKFGTVTLTSRIIHYRLTLFGLYGKLPHHGIDAPFTDESLVQLEVLKSFINWETVSDIEMLNWMGDLSILIDKIYATLNEDSQKNKKNIYVYKDGRIEPAIYGIDENDTIEKITCYYEFMARLFQIYLWTNGLYNGAIDGVIQDRKSGKEEDEQYAYSTKSAIRELVGLLNESDDVERPNNQKFKVTYFYDKFGQTDVRYISIINILKYTKALQKENDATSITEMIDQNDRIRNRKREKIGEKLFTENGRFTDFVIEKVQNRLNDFWANTKRRIYYGINQFKKVFQRILGGLFKKIGSFFKKVFNIVKRIAILVYQEVKEGIKVFIHGFAFLVGKRRIATLKKGDTENEIEKAPEEMVTKFDFDCDAELFIDTNTAEEVIRKHGEKCMNQVNSLKISLVVTAIVVKWILLATSSAVTWPGILLMVGKSLKQINWKTLGKGVLSQG